MLQPASLFRRLFHRMASGLSLASERVRDLLGYMWVLFKVAAPFAAIVGGALYFNDMLPLTSQFRVPERVTGATFVAVCIGCSFFLGATMVSAYVFADTAERRRREQAFRYDDHGTLFNRGEPNVAFRVATFHGILAALSTQMDAPEVEDNFIKGGRLAAENFATELENIMNREVLGNRRWSDLTFAQKLDEWAKYDSATGWGLFTTHYESADPTSHSVRVRVSHYGGLFAKPGGDFFARFLYGYCTTVLTSILSGEQRGILEDLNVVKPEGSFNISADDTVEFLYSLTS